jgi:hypothetical protein
MVSEEEGILYSDSVVRLQALVDELQTATDKQPEATHLRKPGKKRQYRETLKGAARKKAKAKARDKKTQNFSLAACTLANWKGASESDPVYPPMLLQQLRIHFDQLSKIDQRAFIGQGVRCDFDADRVAAMQSEENPRTNFAFTKLFINYRLESPLILGQKLILAQTTGRQLPPPAASDCWPVSQKFLHWAVGCSVSVTNRPDGLSRSVPKSLDDRKCQPNMQRRGDPTKRTTPTIAILEDWFKNQRQEHLAV